MTATTKDKAYESKLMKFFTLYMPFLSILFAAFLPFSITNNL